MIAEMIIYDIFCCLYNKVYLLVLQEIILIIPVRTHYHKKFDMFLMQKQLKSLNTDERELVNLSLAEHDMPSLSKQCRFRSVGF